PLLRFCFSCSSISMQKSLFLITFSFFIVINQKDKDKHSRLADCSVFAVFANGTVSQKVCFRKKTPIFTLIFDLHSDPYSNSSQ
ncbi:hypothetical protein, partial [Parabacteroides goldsteinii]|uniref:hypothetical protein n=1 Tax=Parabacteroides goldsteinii TaxID=328812 RepID=UPI00259B0430